MSDRRDEAAATTNLTNADEAMKRKQIVRPLPDKVKHTTVQGQRSCHFTLYYVVSVVTLSKNQINQINHDESECLVG